MQTEAQLTNDAKLLFEIQHPSLHDVWLEGYEQAGLEIEEEENPYPANSKEHQHWADGWWAGFYGEEPLYNLEGDVIATSANDSVSNHAPSTTNRLTGGLVLGSALLLLCYDLLD
jgi:hypothetical protein